jgi:hypothetical protein
MTSQGQMHKDSYPQALGVVETQSIPGYILPTGCMSSDENLQYKHFGINSF